MIIDGFINEPLAEYNFSISNFVYESTTFS